MNLNSSISRSLGMAQTQCMLYICQHAGSRLLFCFVPEFRYKSEHIAFNLKRDVACYLNHLCIYIYRLFRVYIYIYIYETIYTHSPIYNISYLNSERDSGCRISDKLSHDWFFSSAPWYSYEKSDCLLTQRFSVVFYFARVTSPFLKFANLFIYLFAWAILHSHLTWAIPPHVDVPNFLREPLV